MSHSALIVDDSLTVRMDLQEAFETAGFLTRPCATLAEARQALELGSFAVLVLDVLLPDGDGIDLLAEVRRNPRTAGTVIVLLSTETEVRDRIRGLTTGADEYVGKPYERAYVIARALELVRLKAPPQAPDASTTVLVIDDSATFREELTSALVAAGYRVVVAVSGEEGLRVAADRRPSAIMVDGVLPGIDGATVIRRVRLDAALRTVPCLLLTGSEGHGAELYALDAGADAFVRKEEEIEVILAKLAAVLRRTGVSASFEETTSLLGPKKILAVDDSVTYLQALGETLRGDGYDVILARSGEEALELLAVQSVDCILLDVMMPGLSGQDTCRRIKAAPGVRDVPLLMLTALEDREAMIHGLSVGADDYISKSSDFEILKARVRAQIRRKHFEDEIQHAREELLRKELETMEVRAARDLAQARAGLVDELEKKNRELEAFSYSVSHDLRAPLRSIDGFSQALLDDYSGKLDAKGTHYLERVRIAAQRMAELIDDLLELSRVGRAELRRARVDLSELASRILSELHTREPERAVETEVVPGLFVDADSQLMRVVLDNLLGNAWKFTAKASHAKIALGAEQKEGNLVYFVQDNGAGFNMNFAAKLFSPFQRLHTEAEFPGTGIGLATVYRIVDRHGGRVWAEGAVGQGAVVYFTVPQSRRSKGA
jgi:two-component system, NtrC family, sensor kinase